MTTVTGKFPATVTIPTPIYVQIATKAMLMDLMSGQGTTGQATTPATKKTTKTATGKGWSPARRAAQRKIAQANTAAHGRIRKKKLNVRTRTRVRTRQ